MFVVRMLCGIGALVHQRDQRAARDQLAQNLRQHLVAGQLGHAHMKVAQKLVAARSVFAVHGSLFPRNMVSECLDVCRRGLPRKKANHLGLDDAAQTKHLLGLHHRGRRHKSTARRLQANQLVLRELQQGLAHECARHAKMVGQFLLSQLGTRLQPMLDNRLGERLHDQVC